MYNLFLLYYKYMELEAAIAMTTSDFPKIKPTEYGAEVTFEIAQVSLDDLRELCNQPLTISIKKTI